MCQEPRHISVPSHARVRAFGAGPQVSFAQRVFPELKPRGQAAAVMFVGFCYVVRCVPHLSVKGRCSSKTGLHERPSSYVLDDQALQVTGKTTALACKQLQPTGQRRELRRTCKTAERRSKRRAQSFPASSSCGTGCPLPSAPLVPSAPRPHSPNCCVEGRLHPSSR